MTEQSQVPSSEGQPEEPAAGQAPAEPTPPTAEEYNEFIRGLELTNVWLQSVRVDNHHGPTPPRQVRVDLRDRATWQAADGGFDVFHWFGARIQTVDSPLADIEVTFGLRFRSGVPMSDRLFDVFKLANLPLNTWPYLREFLATTTARMGWLTFTLPTLKRPGRLPSPRRGARPSRRAASIATSEPSPGASQPSDI